MYNSGKCLVCPRPVYVDKKTNQLSEYCSRSCRKNAVNYNLVKACTICKTYPKMLENGQRVDWCGSICKGKVSTSLQPTTSFKTYPLVTNQKSIAYQNDNSMIMSTQIAQNQPIQQNVAYLNTYTHPVTTSQLTNSETVYLNNNNLNHNSVNSPIYAAPKQPIQSGVTYSNTYTYPVTTSQLKNSGSTAYLNDASQQTNSGSTVYLNNNSVSSPIYAASTQPIQSGVAYSNTYYSPVATHQLTNQSKHGNQNFHNQKTQYSQQEVSNFNSQQGVSNFNSQQGVSNFNSPKPNGESEGPSFAKHLAKTAAKSAAEAAVKIAAKAVVNHVLGGGK
ncbi:38886_t:CDS:1 [Gigaspora margarita]|uniref:38886_t:CDS:1 n=1 Tax=Gigaspora margarita TaxID=4874 RepID=A0ABN7VLJ5_GIGMA|nr:38886_t:CDS:1 [Gigaspora margarita]